MPKFLLISGSPRKGNTEYILSQLAEQINSDKELVLLREKNLKRCLGCLACDKTKQCIQQDDMQEIYEKLEQADVWVLGSPNYFNNVSGLLKDFIDRTVPFFYEGEVSALKGKKVFFIVVGGGEVKNSQPVVGILQDFAQIHGMEIIGSHCFQAQEANDAANNPETAQAISEISVKLNSL